MSDCYDSLRPKFKFGIRHNNWDNNGQADEGHAHCVVDQRLLEDGLGVRGAQRRESGQSRGAVESPVGQVRHPFGVGNAEKSVSGGGICATQFDHAKQI